VNKKKLDPNSVLVKHRKYLKGLEYNKNAQVENRMMDIHEKENKTQKFKENAAKQRTKIRTLKDAEMQDDNDQDFGQYEDDLPAPSQAKSSYLNAANLEEVASVKSAPKSKASKSKKGAPARPAWAVTEKMTEDNKEAEIDDLLEFAYELDYEKYMEDEEVRLALGAIKTRINKMTAENNWQENMAEEWNQAQVQKAATKQARVDND